MQANYTLQHTTCEQAVEELAGFWMKPNPDKYNIYKIGLFHGMMMNYMPVYDQGYNIVGHVWKCTITYGHGINGQGQADTQIQALQNAVNNLFEKGCRICSHEDVIQIGKSYEAQFKGAKRDFNWGHFKGLERPRTSKSTSKKSTPTKRVTPKKAVKKAAPRKKVTTN